MPIPVKVYTWPSDGGQIAINELAWTMFDLPEPGSRYWHGRDPYIVRGVDETSDPATVHLEHAAEWADEVRDALPAGYWIEGGRRSEDGSWHFHLVQQGVDRPIGMYFGESLEQGITEVVAGAHAREAQLDQK
jgi:hypothetical protein